MTVSVLFRHPSSLEHDTGAHPENARRIVAIERALSERDWLAWDVRESPAATREQATALKVNLFGSLSATGKGHGTERAALAGIVRVEAANSATGKHLHSD